jgi:hypothetical protein
MIRQAISPRLAIKSLWNGRTSATAAILYYKRSYIIGVIISSVGCSGEAVLAPANTARWGPKKRTTFFLGCPASATKPLFTATINRLLQQIRPKSDAVD